MREWGSPDCMGSPIPVVSAGRNVVNQRTFIFRTRQQLTLARELVSAPGASWSIRSLRDRCQVSSKLARKDVKTWRNIGWLEVDSRSRHEYRLTTDGVRHMRSALDTVINWWNSRAIPPTPLVVRRRMIFQYDTVAAFRLLCILLEHYGEPMSMRGLTAACGISSPATTRRILEPLRLHDVVKCLNDDASRWQLTPSGREFAYAVVTDFMGDIIPRPGVSNAG